MHERTGDEVNAITKNGNLDPAIIESLVLGGDVGKLTPAQKVQYVAYRCKQVGLDPAAQPFQLLRLQGKEVLYATAGATQQLCQTRGLSVSVTKREKVEDIYCVEVRVTDKDGRFSENMGSTPIAGLKGEALSNALLKATTKAIRRTVLAHCGLGLMDETEAETIPGAQMQGRGNPLRQEFQGFSYELDGCKSIEQIDLILQSPEYEDFKNRDAAQVLRGGVGFADQINDRAYAMKKKLPERVENKKNFVKSVDEYPNAGRESVVAPGSGSTTPPASHPTDEILPEYSELVQGFFDRIDLAETAADLKEVSGAIVAKQTELAETDKKALSNAYKLRNQAIRAA